MKPKHRLFSVVLTALLFVLPFGVGAAEAVNPFDAGTLGCDCFRIPAVLTLHDGSVLASADLRWTHGTDAPQNLDIAAAVSPDGYGDWTYAVPNRFDDYADGASVTQSAAYIDSALLQSESGRVFLLCDVFLSGTGYPNAQKGSGCLTRNGKRYIALAQTKSSDYRFYIADFAGDFAPVMENGKPTAYCLDREYRLYKNGNLCTMTQMGNGDAPTGETIAQSIFYAASDLHVFPTPFLCLRHSDDDGKTWSAPTLLNPMLKHDDEAFLGVCPGRGVTIQYGGHERLIFPVYSNERRVEHALTIWSDDGGLSWHRGKDVRNALLLQKTSESQIIAMPDGTLRMFSRTGAHFIGWCDSTDGGESWTKSKPDPALLGTKNCMVSVINTTKTIDEMPVVLCSMGSNVKDRADGVIRVGVINEKQNIDWIGAYPVNSGFFAYSCLTELSDGNIALLYEDAAAHFCYRIFTLNNDGTLTPADGVPFPEATQPSFTYRLLELIGKIIKFFSCA